MSVFWPRVRIHRIDIERLWVHIPPTVDIKFLSCARSPSLLSPFGKMSTDFWWQGVLHVELGLKILVYSFANWLLTVIAFPLELKPISEMLATNSTHTHTRTHRIWLVKLRITYFWYTLLGSQNML